MTNTERIEENNAELREAIEMAEELPEARIEKDDVIDALGYEPASTDIATSSANGLMSAADKKKLDAVIVTYNTGRTDIRSGAADSGYLYIGEMTDEVILHDWDYNEVSVGALIDAVRTICDELGITPFASNFSLRRNVEQTGELNGETTES